MSWWHWYWGEVRGNVLAIIPCGVVAFLWLRSKHLAIVAAHESLKAAHVAHSEKFDAVLDKWDPDSPGGITEVLDRLDPSTKGGLGDTHAVVRETRNLAASVDTRLAVRGRQKD